MENDAWLSEKNDVNTEFKYYDALKETIDNYIEYYNKQRIKEKLGWMSPVEYRLNLLAA